MSSDHMDLSRKLSRLIVWARVIYRVIQGKIKIQDRENDQEKDTCLQVDEDTTREYVGDDLC